MRAWPKAITLALLLLCTLFATSMQSACAQAVAIPDPPQIFVQQFYDWYAPRAAKYNAGPAWLLALRYRKSNLDSKLAEALTADAAAQAKSPRDIVGLDFDPFLASQDPEKKYVVGAAVREGDNWWVDVSALSSSQKHQKPDASVELARKNSKWLIVDLRYPKQHDLITQLKLLQKNRETSGARK